MRYTHAHRNLVLTAVASVVILTASYAVFGWSDPDGAPPESSLPIPLDTGSADQIKSGGLKVKSLTTVGAVGIGIDAPAKPLDVLGDIHASGNVDSNGILNASGISISGVPKNALWDGKEPGISAGTNLQYWRGDKTWQTLNTTAVDEGTNLYFTSARAQSAITGAASTITANNLTASRALYSDPSGKVAVSAITNTELGYLTGVTSALQTQLDAKAPLAGPKFTGNITMPGTGIWESSGKVGIGKTNPAYFLDVNGIINATDIYKNGAPFLAGNSQWNTVGNDINYTNGKVGIGTNAPTKILDVVTNTTENGVIVRDGQAIERKGGFFMGGASDFAIGAISDHVLNIGQNNTPMIRVNTSANNYGISIGNNVPLQSKSQVVVRSNTSSTNILEGKKSDGTTVFLLDSVGKMSIGHGAPAQLLDVRGGTTDISAFARFGNSDASRFITFGSGRSGDSVARIIFANAATRLEIGTSPSDATPPTIGISVLGSNGNVGIGTTTPQSALQIPDGKYLQAEDNNAGAPPVADCDSDTKRGRISLDTVNNRLYICNGAARGWDWTGLSD